MICFITYVISILIFVFLDVMFLSSRLGLSGFWDLLFGHAGHPDLGFVNSGIPGLEVSGSEFLSRFLHYWISAVWNQQ